MSDGRKTHQKTHDIFSAMEDIYAPYHSIQFVTKQNKNSESEWFLKRCEDFPDSFGMEIEGGRILSALCEVVSGELMRYFVGLYQPKTRLVCDRDMNSNIEKISIASKSILDFRALDNDDFDKTTLKNKTGLASSLFMSYFLCEWDAKPENFFESNGTIGRFDCEWTFFKIRAKESNLIKVDITESDVVKFPNVKNFQPGFWPIDAAVGEMLSKDKEFKSELYATMIKILITPDEIIDSIINLSTHDPEFEVYKDRIKNEYLMRLNQFKQILPRLSEFRSFFIEKGDAHFKEIIQSIELFFNANKLKFNESILNTLHDNFNAIKTVFEEHSDLTYSPQSLSLPHNTRLDKRSIFSGLNTSHSQENLNHGENGVLTMLNDGKSLYDIYKVMRVPINEEAHKPQLIKMNEQLQSLLHSKSDGDVRLYNLGLLAYDLSRMSPLCSEASTVNASIIKSAAKAIHFDIDSIKGDIRVNTLSFDAYAKVQANREQYAKEFVDGIKEGFNMNYKNAPKLPTRKRR